MRRGEIRWYTFALPDDGMPAACALNFDHIALAQRARLGATITTLREERWDEVRRALLVGCGFAGED